MEELFGVKSMQDVTPEVIRSSYQKWYESRAQASQESSAGESASEDAVSRFSQGGGESMSDLDKIAARRREKNEKEAVDAQEQEQERISFISSSKELFDEYEIDDNDVADLEAFHHDV